MQTQIRQSVFETNSSSSHSLTVANFKAGDVLDTLYPNSEGSIIVEAREFGWEWEDYNDPTSKLAYCAIYARDWVGNEDISKYLKILTTVVRDHVGDIDVEFPLDVSKSGYFEKGYIDHQSVENHDLDYLFEDPEQLRQFIFNPKSKLKTGNDNESQYDD